MTATARATNQSETFYFDRERSPGVTITLPSIGVDEDRNQYLREGIAKMIRRARRYMRAKDGDGTRWTEGYAGRIIEWALLLKEEVLVQATTAVVEAPIDHPGREVAASDEDRVIEDSASEHSGSLNQPTAIDPFIRSLCESHRARKIFPVGHTFAMTNPVINGHMVTLGTCGCGETFSYAYGSSGHERMDAAIEAHWQKFDATADKIDGRGEPIGAEDWTWNLASDPAANRSHSVRMTCEASSNVAAVCQCGWTFRGEASVEGRNRRDKAVKAHWREVSEAAEKANPKKKRSKKSQPDAPGQPASIASAPDSAGIHGADAPSSDIADAASTAPRLEPASQSPPSPGAGSPLLEPAPIGAGWVAADMAAEPQDDWGPLLLAAIDLAWREEIPPPDPVKEFEQSLPTLMGPEEKRRKVTEFKLALKQKPVNLGPLFGDVPPLDDSNLAEADA